MISADMDLSLDQRMREMCCEAVAFIAPADSPSFACCEEGDDVNCSALVPDDVHCSALVI